MVEFEEKFFVVNLERIKRTPFALRGYMLEALDYIDRHVPSDRYYVCNRDEPYADEVLRIILEGEEKKENA